MHAISKAFCSCRALRALHACSAPHAGACRVCIVKPFYCRLASPNSPPLLRAGRWMTTRMWAVPSRTISRSQPAPAPARVTAAPPPGCTTPWWIPYGGRTPDCMVQSSLQTQRIPRLTRRPTTLTSGCPGRIFRAAQFRFVAVHLCILSSPLCRRTSVALCLSRASRICRNHNACMTAPSTVI